MAVWALAESRTPETNRTLRRVVTADTDKDVREMAAWGLATSGDPEAGNTLSAVLVNETSTRVQATTAWALGTLKVHPAPQALIDLLASESRQVRLTAAWALSHIGDKAALPAIRAALEKPQPEDVSRALLRGFFASGATDEDAARFMSSANPVARSMAVRTMTGASVTDPWPWPWPRPIPIP